MGKAHSNKGRFFKFNNSEELDRFVLLYEDLFTPYSKDVIKDGKSRYDISYLQKGCVKDVYGMENILRVNLTKESMDKILESKCFKKEHWRRNYNIYVMV